MVKPIELLHHLEYKCIIVINCLYIIKIQSYNLIRVKFNNIILKISYE